MVVLKVIMVISIYLLGVFIMMLWFLGDKEAVDALNKVINENPEYAAQPESLLRILSFVTLLLTCMLWPYFIVTSPFRVIKNKIKERKNKGEETK